MNIEYIKKLTDRELKNTYNLNDLEIGFLIDESFLIKKGKKYILQPIIEIRNHGLKLLKNYEMEMANQCFEICYKLAPDNHLICLQYLLIKLKNKQYDNIYEIFANLKKCSSKEEINACNLYLYLLSFLIECPEEFLETTLEVPDYLNLTGMDSSGEKVCALIKKTKYKEAIKLLDLSKKRNSYNLDFEVLRILLSRVIDKDDKFKDYLVELVKEKQYDKINSLLLNIQRIRPLSERETHVLLVVDAINKVSNGIYPEPVRNRNFMHESHTNIEQYDLTESLLRNEFKIATIINNCYVRTDDKTKSGKITSHNDSVGILLKELDLKIRKLKITDIKDIEFLSEFLMKRGVDLKDSGLSLEDMSLIRLVRAINCYNEGFIVYGDTLVEYVKNTYVGLKISEETIAFSTTTINDLMRQVKIYREEAINKFSKNGIITKPKANNILLLKKKY